MRDGVGYALDDTETDDLVLRGAAFEEEVDEVVEETFGSGFVVLFNAILLAFLRV